MRKLLLVVIIMLAAAAAVFLPLVVGDRKALAASETLRGQIVQGMAWTTVAVLLEKGELHHKGIGFNGKDCGFVYFGQAGDLTLKVPESAKHESPDHRTKWTDVKLKNLLDPALAEHRKRCPNLRVQSDSTVPFTHLDFDVVFDADGKVAATTPTRSWD